MSTNSAPSHRHIWVALGGHAIVCVLCREIRSTAGIPGVFVLLRGEIR